MFYTGFDATRRFPHLIVASVHLAKLTRRRKSLHVAFVTFLIPETRGGPIARNTTQDGTTRSNNNEDTMGQRGRGCKAFTLQGEAHRHQGKPDRIYRGAYTKVQMSSLSKNRLKRRYTCWHHQRVMPNNYKYPGGSHNVRGE